MAQVSAPAQNQAQEGEHDWFFDCLITFLKSPRWKTPVVSYMEEYCIVFDNEEENKLEYTTIHQNFYKMVDELLCELVAEMGITREQFKEACTQAANNPTHQRIVQQILSVDDFEAFKKMMLKKNMQINEIAMKEMMKSQQVPAPTNVGAAADEDEAVRMVQEFEARQQREGNAGGQIDEDEQMRLALEMSRVASQEVDSGAKEEEEMIRLAIEASKEEEKQRLAIYQQEEEMNRVAIQESQRSVQVNAAAAVEEKKAEEPMPKNPQEQSFVSQASKKMPLKKLESQLDPEQQRKEEEKLRQLAEMKRRAKEAKDNPPPVKVQEPKPEPVKEQPKIDKSKFLEEQKDVISKIRKPKVQEVSAFEDIHADAMFPEKEDPYAGKSFSEVLKMKREKLENELKASKLESQSTLESVQEKPEEGAQAAAEEEPVDDDSLEGRKRRLKKQREALLAKRKLEREKELESYNKSNGGASLDAARNSFYAQMIKMDAALPQASPFNQQAASQKQADVNKVQKKVLPPQAASVAPVVRQNFNLDDIEGVDIL